MIVGGMAATGSSKKARKTYLRMVQNVQLMGSVLKIARRESPIIGFSEEDARRLHHPPDDALDRKSTRLNSSHSEISRMPSSA